MRLPTLHGLVLLAFAATGCASSSSPAPETDDEKRQMSRVREISDCSVFTPSNASNPDAPAPEKLPFYATGPVATVDGEDIGAETFNRFAGQFDAGHWPASHRKLVSKTALNQVISRHIIERALQNTAVSVSTTAIDEAYKDFKTRFETRSEFRAHLERRALNEDTLRKLTCQDLRLRAMLRETHNLDITEAEARAYYRENKSRYTKPDRVQARHILLDVPDGAGQAEIDRVRRRARRLAAKARRPDTDFGALARKHSDGPSATKGGDLGYFEADQMVDAFSKVAFSLEEGQVSDPVRTKWGFHVIKVTGFKPAHTKTFADVREAIVEKLEKKRTREALDRFLEERREALTIKRHTGNIVVPQSSSGSKSPSPKKKLKLKKPNLKTRP